MYVASENISEARPDFLELLRASRACKWPREKGQWRGRLREARKVNVGHKLRQPQQVEAMHQISSFTLYTTSDLYTPFSTASAARLLHPRQGTVSGHHFVPGFSR